jgi:hypothetical protein
MSGSDCSERKCLFKIWERVLYSPLGLQKDILLVQLAPLRCYVWRYLGLTPHQQPISPFIEQSRAETTVDTLAWEGIIGVGWLARHTV